MLTFTGANEGSCANASMEITGLGRAQRVGDARAAANTEAALKALHALVGHPGEDLLMMPVQLPPHAVLEAGLFSNEVHEEKGIGLRIQNDLRRPADLVICLKDRVVSFEGGVVALSPSGDRTRERKQCANRPSIWESTLSVIARPA